MKRIFSVMTAGLVAAAVSATPTEAVTFYNTCSPGSFKVCASADVTIGPGNTLVIKVWNMNQSTSATLANKDAEYASQFGGWHTIRAIGVAGIGYTLSSGPSTLTAQYFDGTTYQTLSQWAGQADASSLQVYNTGGDTNGHKEGIVGCFDPGPSNANHVSTCDTHPGTPYVQFTISGFSQLSLAGATFEFQGVQAAYQDCTIAAVVNASDPTDECLFGNSFKGTGPPTEVIPEPITMVLLGSGLLGVGGAARRRRRRELELERSRS